MRGVEIPDRSEQRSVEGSDEVVEGEKMSIDEGFRSVLLSLQVYTRSAEPKIA